MPYVRIIDSQVWYSAAAVEHLLHALYRARALAARMQEERYWTGFGGIKLNPGPRSAA